MSMSFSSIDSQAVSGLRQSRLERLLNWLQQTNAALNHDFCPGANRWVYWLKNPLLSLLLAAEFLGVVGVVDARTEDGPRREGRTRGRVAVVDDAFR